MEVMHQSQEALLTILQVLLYDPLYAWTISHEKAYKLQQKRERDLDTTTELNTTTTGDLLDMGSDRHGEWAAGHLKDQGHYETTDGRSHFTVSYFLCVCMLFSKITPPRY